jgi:hypothetical protein
VTIKVLKTWLLRGFFIPFCVGLNIGKNGDGDRKSGRG